MKPLRLAFRVDVPLDFLLQRLHQPGDCHDHRDAFGLDGPHQFGGIQGVLKKDRPRQQLRQKDPQELPKHMAQRQEIQKPQRMEKPFILQVGRDLPFQRFQVGQNVAVRYDYAARFGGCTGGEHDLDDIVARYFEGDRPV